MLQGFVLLASCNGEPRLAFARTRLAQLVRLFGPPPVGNSEA